MLSTHSLMVDLQNGVKKLITRKSIPSGKKILTTDIISSDSLPLSRLLSMQPLLQPRNLSTRPWLGKTRRELISELP